MTVVRNEMERGENSPTGVLCKRMMATAYQWHNYGKSTIGARSDVENVPTSRGCRRSTATTTSRTTPPSSSPAASTPRRWSWSRASGRSRSRRATLAPTYTVDPSQDGERAVTLRRVGGAPLVYVAYHVPPAASADFAAATLLAQVLGDTPGGRLYKNLVER